MRSRLVVQKLCAICTDVIELGGLKILITCRFITGEGCDVGGTSNVPAREESNEPGAIRVEGACRSEYRTGGMSRGAPRGVTASKVACGACKVHWSSLERSQRRARASTFWARSLCCCAARASRSFLSSVRRTSHSLGSLFIVPKPFPKSLVNL